MYKRQNGEVLRSGMHSVARLALLQTKGWSKEDLTVEDVAANLDAAMDLTGSEVLDCHALSQHLK